MENMKLKLSAAAVNFMRTAAETYITMPAENYTAALEQRILAGLLRRKAVMFLYPKEMNTVTLRVEEAAVIHRLSSRIYGMSGDIHIRNMAVLFMMAIGPGMPPQLSN